MYRNKYDYMCIGKFPKWTEDYNISSNAAASCWLRECNQTFRMTDTHRISVYFETTRDKTKQLYLIFLFRYVFFFISITNFIKPHNLLTFTWKSISQLYPFSGQTKPKLNQSLKQGERLVVWRRVSSGAHQI